MVFMALWLDLRNVSRKKKKSLEISTRTAAAELPRLKTIWSISKILLNNFNVFHVCPSVQEPLTLVVLEPVSYTTSGATLGSLL